MIVVREKKQEKYLDVETKEEADEVSYKKCRRSKATDILLLWLVHTLV